MTKVSSRPLAVTTILAALAVGAAAAAGSEPEPALRFAAGVYRPNAPSPAPSWLHADPVLESPAGMRFLVAILRAPLSVDDRRQLESAGAELLDYIPDYGIRLRVSPAAEARVRRVPSVAWLGPVPAQYKIQPSLIDRVAAPTGAVPIRIVLVAAESESRAIQALSGTMTTAAPSGKDGAWRITAMAPASSL